MPTNNITNSKKTNIDFFIKLPKFLVKFNFVTESL